MSADGADAELDLAPATAATAMPDVTGGSLPPADYVQGIFDREMGVTLNNLKAGSPRDEAMRRLTEEASNLYAKRVLRELIQNAFDGAAGGDARILVRLDLREGDGVLLVANSGIGFTSSNVDAVASPAMSNKPSGNFIGHKGLGFRSVELLSDAVEIHSMNGPGRLGASTFDGFQFRFADASDERAWLEARGELDHADRVVGRVHRLQLPIPVAGTNAELDWFAREGFATLIRLPLRDVASIAAASQEMRLLLDEEAPITLFLDRLSTLEIECIDPDGTRVARALTRRSRPIDIGSPRQGLLVEEVIVDLHRFLVARMPVDDAGFRRSVADAVTLRHPVTRWAEWDGTPEVSMALPLAGEAARACSTPSCRWTVLRRSTDVWTHHSIQTPTGATSTCRTRSTSSCWTKWPNSACCWPARSPTRMRAGPNSPRRRWTRSPGQAAPTG